MVVFPTNPLLLGYKSCDWYEMVSKSGVETTILIIVDMDILFIVMMEMLTLVKWSYIPPKITLTTKPRMIIKFWACNLISFKHVSFEHPFLEPYQNTCHSNIGLQVWSMTKLGMFNLLYVCDAIFSYISMILYLIMLYFSYVWYW